MDDAEASRQDLLETVTEMASRGLRTLCLAYADVSAAQLGPLQKLEGPPQLPLTACCMLGIKVRTRCWHVWHQGQNSMLVDMLGITVRLTCRKSHL